jgi:hypothetical protein
VRRINSVDGSHAALEIDSRSSYVPSLLHWRLIPASGDAPEHAPIARLEMPTWTKF